MKKTPISLVLSGGGARGFAHLGVVKALLEHQYEIQEIVGTSAGAIAGAMIASGHSPEEALRILMDSKALGFKNFNWDRLGFFNLSPLQKIIVQHTPNQFELLKIPLTVTTTNLEKGKPQHFSTGEIALPVMASSCIPILFKPIEIDGQLHVDGGILNNFPVENLKLNQTLKVGVFLGTLNRENIKKFGRLKLAATCLNLAMSQQIPAKKRMCNLFIEPPLSDFGVLAWQEAEAIFEIGYSTAIDAIQKQNSM